MWQVARNNRKVMLLVLIVSVLSLLTVIITSAPTVAQETKQNNNMRELLESMEQRTTTESGSHVTIKFAQPLVDTDEANWEIPYESQDGDLRRNFGEIGDDFVCFDEQAGSSYGTRCTPFSNIVAITYFNSP